MVKPKHQRYSINIHPLEKPHHSGILVKSIRGVYGHRRLVKTDGFVMGYAITQFVYVIKFLEYVRIVTLEFGRLSACCRWFSVFVGDKNRKKNDCFGKESNKSFRNLFFNTNDHKCITNFSGIIFGN